MKARALSGFASLQPSGSGSPPQVLLRSSSGSPPVLLRFSSSSVIVSGLLFLLLFLLHGGFVGAPLDMCSQTKAAALMANLPRADIDPSGVFKYVLIRVHSREEGDDSEVDIVRGYGWAEYHADIYDRVSEELEKDGLLDCECLGGGRIRHEPQSKKIHVYGYSMGFGRANHAVSSEKLKERYPDYEVSWSNEGY